MHLGALTVIHSSKENHESGPPSIVTANNSFHLETCQRWLWIYDSEVVPETGQSNRYQRYQGEAAYHFLLRFAVGLESKIVGETDIFGQFKEAWRKVSEQHLSEFQGLEPWMQKIFEDTKEIRTRYLRNTGGTSYGSLVRKLIGKNDSKINLEKPALILGAGQIAESIAPYLMEQELWLWNRTPENLERLVQKLHQRNRKQKEQPRKLIRKLHHDEEQIGWSEAQVIVACIPVDEQLDAQRMDWFAKGGCENRILLHLGSIRANAGLWKDLPNSYFLDDLYSLQEGVSDSRALQIKLAENACKERAKLRSLSMSLSISHCWEDLACFA